MPTLELPFKDSSTCYENLAASIRVFPQDYLGAYGHLDHAVREHLEHHRGTKGQVNLRFDGNDQQLLRLTAVMSDVTSVYLKRGATQSIQILREGHRSFPQHLHIPDKAIENYDMDLKDGKPMVSLGLKISTGPHVESLLREIEPLVEMGVLIPRASATVLILGAEPTTTGTRNWLSVDVDPSSPASRWAVIPDDSLNANILLETSDTDRTAWSKLSEVIVPYLDGISFPELAKVLSDESDLLSGFRSSLKELVQKSSGPERERVDLYNDVVRPATDRISRKFQTISNVHSLKIAGVTCSAVALSLLGLLGIDAVSNAMLLGGGGGLAGLLAKEAADYVKASGELRDEPLYLLWKLSTARKNAN